MGIKENFGKRLRELRTKQGITQEKFSEIIGIQPENYSRIENGLSFPKPENIEKIALALDVGIDELFKFEHFTNIEYIRKRLLSAINNDDNATRVTYEFLSSIGKI
ncbi:helix-turn-helix transcriptional regulator [bacterium]|nr:helix-turn-helix transcriptional regulator [bacterium]